MAKEVACRALDLVATVALVLLLAPLLLLIALIIRLDSPGPVLFRQQRVGRGRRTSWSRSSGRCSTAPRATTRSSPRHATSLAKRSRLLPRGDVRSSPPSMAGVLIGLRGRPPPGGEPGVRLRSPAIVREPGIQRQHDPWAAAASVWESKRPAGRTRPPRGMAITPRRVAMPSASSRRHQLGAVDRRARVDAGAVGLPHVRSLCSGSKGACSVGMCSRAAVRRRDRRRRSRISSSTPAGRGRRPPGCRSCGS